MTATKTFKHPSEPVTLTAVSHLSDALAVAWLKAWAGDSLQHSSAGRQGPGSLAAPELPGSRVLLKEDRSRAGRRLLRAACGRSNPSRRSFEVGLELARAGIRASRPLALLERRVCGLVAQSCVIFEPIEGLTLRDFILTRVDLASSETRGLLKRMLWDAVATEVARLHSAGARQRDLKAPNVIVAEDAHGQLHASLIDLEGMACLGHPPSRRVRVRDLARLAASLGEKAVVDAGVTADDWRYLVERYLLAYSCSPLHPHEVKSMLAWTLDWADRKMRRNTRRGRVTW